MKIFVTIIFACWITAAKSQIVEDSKLTEIVSNNILETYKPLSKKIVLFSAYLYVNEIGKLDSVGFSQMRQPITLKQIINKPLLISKIYSEESKLHKYKNSVIIMSFMVRYLDEISAMHLYELQQDFVNLYPKITDIKNRKIVLLKPTWIAIGVPEH